MLSPTPLAGFAIKTMQAIDALSNGQPALPHRHYHYTVIWAMQAEGIHYIDFQAFPLQPNTIYFIAPEQMHRLALVKPPTGEVIIFTADFLFAHVMSVDLFNQIDLFFNCSQTVPVVLTSAQAETIHPLIDAMHRESEIERFHHQAALGALLRLFLLYCGRARLTGQVGSPPTKIIPLVKDFKKGVEAHFQQLHKVSHYADLLNVTAHHLNETFKAATGSSAKEHIQARIILEAKRLAHSTHQSVKEVAFELGFADPAHFSKFFKNCVGSSYSDFRDRLAATSPNTPPKKP